MMKSRMIYHVFNNVAAMTAENPRNHPPRGNASRRLTHAHKRRGTLPP